VEFTSSLKREIADGDSGTCEGEDGPVVGLHRERRGRCVKGQLPGGRGLSVGATCRGCHAEPEDAMCIHDRAETGVSQLEGQRSTG
jgi:hypothetical protein